MLPDQMPAPPLSMIMPPIYGEMVISNFVVLALVALWLLRDAIKLKTLIPIFMFIGAGIASLTECIWDNLDAVWYPQYGQTPMYRMFDVSVPNWMLAVYPCYIGGIGYLFYKRLRTGMPASEIWLFYAMGWIANFVVELPVLHLGIYDYYGAQPFKMLGFPLWQAMGNAVMPIVVGSAVYIWRDSFKGLGSLFVIPTVPIAITLPLVGIGWPTMLALHSGYGYQVTYPAAIISFLFSILMVHLIAQKMCRETVTQATGKNDLAAQLRGQGATAGR